MTLYEIGRKVREVRRQQKLTQEQLALSAGVSRRFIYRLENGEGNDLGIHKVLVTLECLGLELNVQVAPDRRTLPDIQAGMQPEIPNGAQPTDDTGLPQP